MQGVFPQTFPVSAQVRSPNGAPSAHGPRAMQMARGESRSDLYGSDAADASRGDKPFASYLGDVVRSMEHSSKFAADVDSSVRKAEIAGSFPLLSGSLDDLKNLIRSLLAKHFTGDAGERIARTVEGDSLPCGFDNGIAEYEDDLTDLSALASLLPIGCRMREFLENAALGKYSDSMSAVHRLQGTFREMAALYRRLMIDAKAKTQDPGATAALSAGMRGNREHAGLLNIFDGASHGAGYSERVGRGLMDSLWDPTSNALPSDSLRRLSQVAESLIRDLKQALGETDIHPLTHAYLPMQPMDSPLKGMGGTQSAAPADLLQIESPGARFEIIRQAQNALHEMLDRMRGTVVLDPGAKDAFVRLDPPVLGRLQIQMQVDDSQRVVAVIRSSNPDTQAFLDQNKEELRRGLSEQGFDPERSEIRVAAMDEEMFGTEMAGSLYRRTRYW